MKGCGRHFCPSCGGELIHRDHRRAYESASAIGQIVWREGPVRLTTGDIDHYSAVFSRLGADLLRLIEHKQPTQELKEMQRKVLLLLGQVLEHAIQCEDFEREIDPRSGVFVIRGDVGAETDGQRRTHLIGPQQVSKAVGDQFEDVGLLETAEDLYCWLEGRRNGKRRHKRLPLPERIITE